MPYDAIDLIKKEQSVYGSLRAALFDWWLSLFVQAPSLEEKGYTWEQAK